MNPYETHNAYEMRSDSLNDEQMTAAAKAGDHKRLFDHYRAMGLDYAEAVMFASGMIREHAPAPEVDLTFARIAGEA